MTAGDPASQAERPAPPPITPASGDGFPIVGLGASAGGLDAFRRLFDAMPADTGMAFILIQHLDPTHESMMVDLLAGHTPMKVQQAADGMPVEPEHIYLIPPGCYLSIRAGALRLSDPKERHGARMPVDVFLRSLAEEAGRRAIAVILSGTGTDGSLGLKAVKAKGGLAIVQSPDEAAYDGMPRSAMMTGAVDRVLPLAEIPEALVDYGRRAGLETDGADEAGDDHVSDDFAEIIELLRAMTAHDFALYKPGTLRRRIDRRMGMTGISDGGRYLDRLRHDPNEIGLLTKDLLINVTSFFRDPQAFDAFAETIVPDLVHQQPLDRPLRIWVTGCSTGEEAYSLAMLFLEEMSAEKRAIKMQIFASDVDPEAVALAREGVYPESIAGAISPARLARFFTKEDHSYRVVPELRGLVVFTVHDVLADPPFSRLDLVSCRNLLIYLRPEAQEKVLLLFHFALREGGTLFLGTAETVGSLGDRFEPISKTQRIYRRVGRSRPGEVDFPIAGRPSQPFSSAQTARQTARPEGSLGDLTHRLLLETYAPASVLINRQYESLYFLGPTDRYLRVAAGEPSRDLLAMAREGLRNKLRAAVQQASQDWARTLVTGARVTRDGGTFGVGISVQPVQDRGDGEDLFLVSFLDESGSAQRPATPAGDVSRTAELERELDATRKELQSAIRDLEMSTEEQKAINEEAMSVNEEFQSTNEELVTSKEELQSLNEELTALNGQLQETLERQRGTSNDLQNILHSSGVATLFLDSNLNIRFFTPAAKSLFHFITTDVGRPLADLTPLADNQDLLADAQEVLTTLTPHGREICTPGGTWYLRRILPYRTDDNRIEGVVITFTDIAETKAAEREIQAARVYSDNVINTVRQPLIVLDQKFRIVSGNRSFHDAFALEPEQAVGREFGSIIQNPSAIDEFRSFLKRAQADPAPVDDCEIEIDLPPHGRRSLLLTARKLPDGPSGAAKILLAIEDITERKRAAQAVEAARRQAEQANAGKSRFLAAASHDLRQPLQTLSLLQGILAKKVKDEDAAKLLGRLGETVDAMSAMLNSLLDINQLEAGVVSVERVDFPVMELFKHLRAEFAYHAEARGLGWRVVPSRLSAYSDPRLLEQMIRNLLSNAVKYTDHGKVLLGCRRHGGKLRIEVWDTGRGIPQEKLGVIFEEFRQLDNPARERSRGLGLGLAIVQRLADLLGHAIDVRSRPDKGSVFAVEVPLARGQPGRSPADREHPDGPPAQDAAGRSAAILIVEDEPMTCEMLKVVLEDEGHRAATAGNGRQALDLVEQQAIRPDLVLSDYNLPNGLNGLEVVARVQQMLHREIPSIILTGDTSAETLSEIARRGGVHLSKPVGPQELIELIQHLLARPEPAALPDLSPPAHPAAGGCQPFVIFVVDDDRSVRETMRDMLQDEGRMVEIYGSCEAFLEAFGRGRDGCLLVDARMPGMSGLELLQRLKDEGHRLPAIMITGYGDVATAVQAMKAGAAEFIEKPVGRDELLAGIERAVRHAGDAAAPTAARERAAALIGRLTVRQRQILDLVLAGHPSKSIAADLGVSQRTVDNHRAAIMKKTGSKSLSALVRTALIAV